MHQIFSLTVVLALALFGPASKPAGPQVTILTSPLGIREGTDVYRLGMRSVEFSSRFGPPEKTRKRRTGGKEVEDWFYVNDGIVVGVSDGKVGGIACYLRATEEVKAGSIETENGIGQGASLRQVVKAFGSPTKRHEYDAISVVDLEYHLEPAETIHFSFRNGELECISFSRRAP